MPNTDKLDQLHERLLAQTEALMQSQGWQDFLAMAARFHRYSANNVMLILAQAPHATQVGGYRRWQSLGRQVRKGERGIAILAPCVKRRWPVDDEETDQPELVRILRGFRVAHVWDLSQTDGEPLPDVRPALLAGKAPAGLWGSLAQEVRTAGFELARGDCGGANGRTDYLKRTVRVRDDVDDAQAVKTLAHELAHVWLHDPEHGSHHRGTAEVEAESVAYVVCHASGLDTADYTLPYLATWAGGDIAAIRSTAERVLSSARRALEAAGLIEPNGEGLAA
jgi:hypothetical protein